MDSFGRHIFPKNFHLKRGAFLALCILLVAGRKNLERWNEQGRAIYCSCDASFWVLPNTGKNNGFPFLDILGNLKNSRKNPKFGRVRQVPIRKLDWEFPGWDLSHFAKFGIFMSIL